MNSSTESTSSSMDNTTEMADGGGVVAEDRSCKQWFEIFGAINKYFRDDDILTGSDHSSTVFGYLITMMYSLVIAFGVFGNLLTIVAILRNRTMRTTRNFFILNLALSDFFMSTVTAPTTLYTILYVFWPFGQLACSIAGSLQGFNIFLSTFSITAIALDRYVLVIFPTKRERQHNLALLFFSLIWVISFLLALPLFEASDLNVIFEDPKCNITLTVCHEQNKHWEKMIISKEFYTLGVLFVQYSIPLVAIAFAYSRIARRMGTRFAARCSLPDVGHDTVVNRRRKSIADRQRRTHFLMISLVVIFAIAWLPLNVFHLLNSFAQLKFNVPTFAFCHIFAVGSACLNPLAYAFFNQNFRSEFVSIFEKIGLVKMHDRLTNWLKVGKQSANKSKNYTIGPDTINTTFQRTHYNAISEADLDLKTAIIIQQPETPQNTSDSNLVVVTNTV